MVSIYHSHEQNPVTFSDIQLLQLTSPTHRVRFVKYGTDVHLLVYLHAHHELPFIRVPVGVLLNSARQYERNMAI